MKLSRQAAALSLTIPLLFSGSAILAAPAFAQTTNTVTPAPVATPAPAPTQATPAPVAPAPAPSTPVPVPSASETAPVIAPTATAEPTATATPSATTATKVPIVEGQEGGQGEAAYDIMNPGTQHVAPGQEGVVAPAPAGGNSGGIGSVQKGEAPKNIAPADNAPNVVKENAETRASVESPSPSWPTILYWTVGVLLFGFFVVTTIRAIRITRQAKQ